MMGQRVLQAFGLGSLAIAVPKRSDLGDGVIDAMIAGDRRAGAPEAMREFVGIAFRVAQGASQFECFYLRPTNGRADDQLRRNHATQYISHPDYPWFRLRDETPGVYESYADLVPGAWTAIQIAVSGARARLHVNGARQPTLIVTTSSSGRRTARSRCGSGQVRKRTSPGSS
ncbi:MAG TPA: hypothetical protein VI007_04240 [bacterium]